MHRALPDLRPWLACLMFAAGCTAPAPEDEASGGAGGKADDPSNATAGTWTREIVSDNATLWNGGPVGWGAGTSIALRADGQPVIAYYDASNRCNNGGFGTYSPDSLMVARMSPTGWQRRIEACGPEWGYWPRLRVDNLDRTHVLFGGGWYTGMQRSYYVRWSPAGAREAAKFVDSSYMSSGALALTVDDTGAPIMIANGKLVSDNGTKTPVFPSSTSQTYAERDADGALHILGNTMVPEPNNPSTSISRMRYAHHDTTGTTIETPRTVPLATPLGIAIDSDGQPHILSWSRAMPALGELWHTTRTASGWVDELIASNVATPSAAMTIADDELLVVAPGKLFRKPLEASSWTATTVTTLSSASNLSIAVAPDGTVHVAFQIVGPIMSNRVSRAYVYHAAYRD